MKTFAIILTIFLTVSCAKHTAFNIQNESSNKTAKVNSKKVDNNAEKYKHYLEDNLYLISMDIMKDEVEITNALSYKRMLRYVGYIKEKLNKSFEVIERYRKRSSDDDYQQYIKYVDCTHKAIYASYEYMETFIKSEQEKQTIKQLDKFKEKMRADTSKLFMKDMEKCEKIR